MSTKQKDIYWFGHGRLRDYSSPQELKRAHRKKLREHNSTAWSPIYKSSRWQNTGWTYYCKLYGEPFEHLNSLQYSKALYGN